MTMGFTELYKKSQLPFIQDKLEEILNKIDENESVREDVKELINIVYSFKEFNRVHKK